MQPTSWRRLGSGRDSRRDLKCERRSDCSRRRDWGYGSALSVDRTKGTPSQASGQGVSRSVCRRRPRRGALVDSKLIPPLQDRNVNPTITCQIRDPGIAFLIFDRPGSAANIFDQATFGELNTLLDQIENDTSVRGLVIATAYPKIFIADADLTGFSKPPSAHRPPTTIEPAPPTLRPMATVKVPPIA